MTAEPRDDGELLRRTDAMRANADRVRAYPSYSVRQLADDARWLMGEYAERLDRLAAADRENAELRGEVEGFKAENRWVWDRLDVEIDKRCAAEARLELGRAALIDTGYFTEDEVGRDIGPRITELHSAMLAAPQPEPEGAPYETPEEAAANDAIPAEPISPEFRQRLIAAVERPLRVRRAILLLAGHASGHLPGFDRGCRVCRRDWPCEDTQRAAAPALEAFADVTPEPPASDEPTGRSD